MVGKQDIMDISINPDAGFDCQLKIKKIRYNQAEMLDYGQQNSILRE
jgi:hypothetical protein